MILNRYFNTSCFDNLGGIQACLNTIDQFCDGSNNLQSWITVDCAAIFDQQGVAGTNYGDPSNFDQISFLDALNFPAECPVEMKTPYGPGPVIKLLSSTPNWLLNHNDQKFVDEVVEMKDGYFLVSSRCKQRVR